MSDKEIITNDTDEITSILSTIDALLSVSDRKDEIVSKAVPLSEIKIEKLREEGFAEAQLTEISKGLEKKLPVNLYAKKELNWMQMSEIRLGLMDGLDVTVYANSLFSASQMREIRLGLLDHLDVSAYAKLMLSATDMRRIRKVLFNEAYKAKEKHFGRTVEDEATGVLLRISEDCLEAYMRIPEGAGTDLAEPDLLQILADHEITYGIIQENLSSLLEQDPGGDELCVAQGKAPIIGKSGWYELFFKNTIENSHYLPPDREIDYSSVSAVENVAPGDVLAKYHPAQTDTGGITVTNIPVDGINGEELPRLTGVGIRYDDSERTYIATTSGHPSYSNVTNSLNVWRIHEVAGNVSYLQSMSFDGIIHVSGSVQNMAVLRATGDIIIDGFVEGAHIFSDQNVIIKGGVNGGEQGSITAGGFLHGKFFENATIRANGSIEGNYFLNCTISTDNSVFARGKKSRIIGGSIEAAYCIEAAVIGNYLSHKTIFQVGDTASINKRITDNAKTKEKALAELQELTLGQQKLIMLLGDATKDNDLYNKTCSAIYTKELQVSTCDREVTRLKAALARASKAYVKVNSRLQEDVVFIINGNKKIVDRTITRGIVLTKQSTKQSTKGR